MGQVPLAQTPPNTFAFSFSQDVAVTSAAVYDSNGVLINTLWANKPFKVGNYTAKWNGLDYNNVQQPFGNTYQIKIHSNNNTIVWEGVIGNNSDNLTGNTVWRSGTMITGMVQTGLYMRCGFSFSEASTGHCKFLLTQPNQKVQYTPQGQTDQASYFVCANATYVLWGGKDYTGTQNFVFGEFVSNDTIVPFTSGQPMIPSNGITYQYALDLNTNGFTGVITGMAIQQTGSGYLFVSHANQNLINVFLTSDGSGTQVQSISISNPGNICLENDNTLWVSQGTTLTKYTVNSDGTITATATQITGFASIAGLDILSGTIGIFDAGNQQIPKFYDSTTLNPIVKGTWQSGGHANTPVVGNNRFYISDIRGQYITSFTFQSDGSFWLVDTGNCRTMHFDSSGNYLNQICYIPGYQTLTDGTQMPVCYNVNVCYNLNTSIFNSFLEFITDYSQPITSSYLANNWGYNIPLNYINSTSAGSIILCLNNRRYMLLQPALPNYYQAELTSTGARLISNQLPEFCAMDANGNLFTYATTNAGGNYTASYQEYTLTGFDGSNNPIYSSPITIATINLGFQGPIPQDRYFLKTSSNKIIIFDNNLSSPRSGTLPVFHLAAYDGSTFENIWMTGESTFTPYIGIYPNPQAFDIGNFVIRPGGSAVVIGNNIAFNYHGENWKKNQTGVLIIFDDNGLFKGIAGVLGPQVIGQIAPYGYYTNSQKTNYIQVGSDYYLYFSDESIHCGLHRWKVSNTDSESTQTVSLTLSNRQYTKPITRIDLLKGIPDNQQSINGTPGWSQFPIIDTPPSGTNQFYTISRKETYNFNQSPDFILFMEGLNVGTYFQQRELFDLVFRGDFTYWQVSGSLDLTINSFTGSESNFQKSFMQVVDVNGKVIARIDFYQTFRISFNNVFQTPTTSGDKYGESQFIIKRDGVTSNIYFMINLWGEWITVSLPMFDLTADITNPYSISWNYKTSIAEGNAQFGIIEAWFEGN